LQNQIDTLNSKNYPPTWTFGSNGNVNDLAYTMHTQFSSVKSGFCYLGDSNSMYVGISRTSGDVGSILFADIANTGKVYLWNRSTIHENGYILKTLAFQESFDPVVDSFTSSYIQVTVSKSGKIKNIFFNSTPSADLIAKTSYHLTTITNSNYLPSREFKKEICISTTSDGKIYTANLTITTGGAVYLYPRQTISVSIPLYVNEFFI